MIFHVNLTIKWKDEWEISLKITLNTIVHEKSLYSAKNSTIWVIVVSHSELKLKNNYSNLYLFLVAENWLFYISFPIFEYFLFFLQFHNNIDMHSIFYIFQKKYVKLCHPFKFISIFHVFYFPHFNIFSFQFWNFL